ncbi:hypothetical protein BJV82DRAFT_33585 [Fennellomyces sp. T-0311]|nr:hypothetical protein BJV82DRAFT_33585 [Fennellomyces sp. T-0311]
MLAEVAPVQPFEENHTTFNLKRRARGAALCLSLVNVLLSEAPKSNNITASNKQQKLSVKQEDEGFASSSSVEEGDLTVEIIRRKRAQRNSKRLGNATPPPPQLMTLQQDYSATNVTAAPLERILWITSFAWAMWRGSHLLLSPTVLAVWILLFAVGLVLVHRSVQIPNSKPTKLPTESPFTTTTSSDTLESETPPNSPLYKTGEPKRKPQPGFYNNCLGLFGAGKSSFRADADDGLLCGVFLLPMVAMAKMTDVARSDVDSARMHVKFELVLLMTLIFLILVLANRFLQPMRRIIRKRGLFVSSMVVSIAFTHGVTRLSPLTPVLSQIPISMIAVPVTAFQWALYTCTVALKRCFTLGEMCVLSEATAILVYGALEYIFAALFPDLVPTKAQDVDPVSVLLHAVILGMLFIGAISYPLLRRSRHLAQKPYWRSSPSAQTWSDIQRKRIIIAFAAYGITIGIVVLAISPVCKSIMHQDPFVWTLSFVFLSPQRLFLCVYWALAVAATVIVWVLVLDFGVSDGPVEAKVLTSALNKKRKLFHALAVIMFTPGVLFELPFLQLAFGVALSAFIYLEYLRYFAVWPYGKSIHMFLTEFIDSRDLGPVILSHIYLLLGCAGPVWLGGSNLLASLSGIVALGFGDAAASLVGKKWGRYRWPGTKKTVEGTVAFVIAVYTSSLLIMYVSALLGISSASRFVTSAGRGEWGSFLITASMTGLLEAFSSQNDNIMIPLYIYALILLQ